MNGMIVRLGKLHGVPVPVNLLVYKAIKEMEALYLSRRSPGVVASVSLEELHVSRAGQPHRTAFQRQRLPES